MDRGALVPDETIIDTLLKAMKGKKGVGSAQQKLIIDGFPRVLSQGLIYESKVSEVYLIVLFNVAREILFDRMLKRVADTPVEKRRSDDKPEVLENRINTFMNETMKACDFYNRLGRVRVIEAQADPDTVFKSTIEALTPTLICVVGAVCTGKTTLARRIQTHMHYGYIDFKKFCAVRALSTCEAKTMALIAFLDRVPSRTFVLDGFPQTKKQAKILFESFGNPHKLFYLEAEKDEVHNRIHAYSSQNRSVSSDALKAEFDEYLRYRDELHGFVKDKPYFHSVSSQQPHEAIFKQCRDTFSPTIHFCNKHENKALCNEYIKKMEKKGFVYLSLEKVIDSEIARGLDLGRRLNEDRSTDNIFELVRRLIYAEPAQNKKYIIANFPNDLAFLQRFPEEVCNFSLILHFTKTEGPDPESQLANYADEFLDVVGNFYTEGRLVGIGLNDPGIVDFHTEKRNKYGIIIGAPTTGKTTIAKALKKSETVKVYLFDKFKEQVIKRLTKDDVAPDDATMAQVLTELNKDLQAAPPNEFFLLDGFSWADSNFESLVKICGEPYFVLKLDAARELLVKRYMGKQGISELSDEDNENINKGIAAFQEVAGKVSELLKENSNLKVFSIDISIPEANTVEAVKRCFRKRIILTRVASRAVDQPKLRNVVAWLCAKFEYQFIDMEAVLQEVARHNPYGIKDPQAILQNIKLRIDANKRLLGNVLIFNYLQSDLRAGDPETEFYPNSKDEIFYLEQHIGKIRACFNFVDQPENLVVEEKLIPKSEKPVPVKKKKDDGTDDDAADPVDDPDATDEDKKKFKPENYDWFEVSDTPRTFPQFFTEMHHTEQVTVGYSNLDHASLRDEFYRIHKDMEEGRDEYFYIEMLAAADK